MATTQTQPAERTMTSVVQDRYGTSAEGVLRIADVRRPAVGDGEVLVRVAAASVDRGTWHLTSGRPYLMRIAGFGLRTPKAANPGRCIAGTVEAVGAGVTGFHPGDEVFGTCEGAFAEYAVARPGRLARKPATLSFEDAAAVPISGATALQAVRDRGHVEAGHKVLVIGASGGVGTFAVQIAKAFGAEVTGVCSTAKVEVVRAAGADHVVDYTQEDFAAAGHRYDVVLDIGGNSPLSRLRRALTATGTLVIVGGTTDGRWLGGIDRQVRASLLSPFVGQTLGSFMASENAEDFAVLGDLADSAEVVPVIDRSYPLHEVPAAIRYVADGHARGKVVVTVGGEGTHTPDTSNR